jgi:NTE family protein
MENQETAPSAPSGRPPGTGRVRLAASLRRRAGIEFFPPGAVLVRQGEATRRLFLIASGTVRVMLGAGRSEQVVARLGRGSWIGETALLTGAVSSTTVIAETEVRVFAISQQDFLAAAETDPAIFREIAAELAQRLRSADQLIGHGDERRLVALHHDPAQAPHAEQIIAACARWAPGIHVAVVTGDDRRDGPSVADYASDGADLSALRARLADGTTTIISTGGATDAELSAFLRAVADFAPLVVYSGQHMPPAIARGLTEIVSLGQNTAPLAPPRSSPPVPRHVFPVGGGFDPQRVARHICRQRIGLALGGGGARGFAHIGVLSALSEAGIPCDAISGTSIGAAVAAGIASGLPPESVAAAVESAGRFAAIPSLLPLHGVFTSAFVERQLRRQFGDLRIEDLTTPLGVVAVDLHAGEEVVFTSGDLVPALMASMAVPGIFAPVRYQGRVLVDGAVRSPVPVRACRDLGADFVIASRMLVTAAAHTTSATRTVPWMPETIAWALDLMQTQIAAESAGGADLAIDTLIARDKAGLFDFGHRHHVEAAGKAAAESALSGTGGRLPGSLRAA